MAECYLIAVSVGSSLDRDTNNWSLFGLTEQIRLPEDTPLLADGDAILPLEVHIYWQFAPKEVGQTLEFRLIVSGSTGEKQSRVFSVASDHRRHRSRIAGFPLFAEGDIRIGVESRFAGSNEWVKSPAFWPLLVER